MKNKNLQQKAATRCHGIGCIIACIIGSTLLALSACNDPIVLSPRFEVRNSPVRILLYASADNRDAGSISDDFRELMESEAAPGYEFWVLYDSANSAGIQSGIQSGLYRGLNGYWERIALETASLPKNLNMGDPAVLKAFVAYVFPPGTQGASVLILSGEGGAVFEGPLLDQGSLDYLRADEIANALSDTNIDLLVVDSGFSAGLEFLHEMSTGLASPPLMLLSPGQFPRSGRNYSRLFSRYPVNSAPNALALASHIQNEFRAEHAADPLSTQVIVDPAGAQEFMGHFNRLLEGAYSYVDVHAKRTSLRSEILLASPVYYETPGYAHYALSAILDSVQNYLNEDISPSLVDDCRQSLSALYPLGEGDDGGNASTVNVGENRGELSLLFVPLFSNGRPNPEFPEGYTVEGSKLAFARDSAWCPNIGNESGLLHRLWLESLPEDADE